jgi:hypothetical protein
MAKVKRQMANGQKNNLTFALCHLPFEIVLGLSNCGDVCTAEVTVQCQQRGVMDRREP